jgi:trimeric autotransporter adhesin
MASARVAQPHAASRAAASRASASAGFSTPFSSSSAYFSDYDSTAAPSPRTAAPITNGEAWRLPSPGAAGGYGAPRLSSASSAGAPAAAELTRTGGRRDPPSAALAYVARTLEGGVIPSAVSGGRAARAAPMTPPRPGSWGDGASSSSSSSSAASASGVKGDVLRAQLAALDARIEQRGRGPSSASSQQEGRAAAVRSRLLLLEADGGGDSGAGAGAGAGAPSAAAALPPRSGPLVVLPDPRLFPLVGTATRSPPRTAGAGRNARGAAAAAAAAAASGSAAAPLSPPPPPPPPRVDPSAAPPSALLLAQYVGGDESVARVTKSALDAAHAKAAAAANVSAYRRHALGLPPAPLLPAPSATPAASAAAAAAAASAASAPAPPGELSLLQYSSAADGTAYRASVPLVHSSGGAAALWPALHGFGAASATPQQQGSSSFAASRTVVATAPRFPYGPSSSSSSSSSPASASASSSSSLPSSTPSDRLSALVGSPLIRATRARVAATHAAARTMTVGVARARVLAFLRAWARSRLEPARARLALTRSRRLAALMHVQRAVRRFRARLLLRKYKGDQSRAALMVLRKEEAEHQRRVELLDRRLDMALAAAGAYRVAFGDRTADGAAAAAIAAAAGRLSAAGEFGRGGCAGEDAAGAAGADGERSASGSSPPPSSGRPSIRPGSLVPSVAGSAFRRSGTGFAASRPQGLPQFVRIQPLGNAYGLASGGDGSEEPLAIAGDGMEGGVLGMLVGQRLTVGSSASGAGGGAASSSSTATATATSPSPSPAPAPAPIASLAKQLKARQADVRTPPPPAAHGEESGALGREEVPAPPPRGPPPLSPASLALLTRMPPLPPLADPAVVPLTREQSEAAAVAATVAPQLAALRAEVAAAALSSASATAAAARAATSPRGAPGSPGSPAAATTVSPAVRKGSGEAAAAAVRGGSPAAAAGAAVGVASSPPPPPPPMPLQPPRVRSPGAVIDSLLDDIEYEASEGGGTLEARLARAFK